MLESICIFSYNMDTIFVNSAKSKASDLHRLVFNLADKMDLKKE